MPGGSHSHGGGSSGAHSHGGGGAAAVGGGCVLFILVLLVGAILGPLLYHEITKVVEDRHDKSFNQEDNAIRSAKLHIKCYEVGIHDGVGYVGAQCSSRARSGAFVMELKGLPAGVVLRSAPSRGQYDARCVFLESRNDPIGFGSDSALVSSPTTVRTGPSWQANISLPGNACIIPVPDGSKYVKIAIYRAGADSSSGQYAIRQVVLRIDPSWHLASHEPGACVWGCF